MHFFISVLLIASSLFGHAPSDSPKIEAGDVQRLTGAKWVGTLTYLDYGRNKKVSIPSNLTVSRSSDDGLSWVFDYEYPKEPKANGKKDVTLGAGGTTFGGETVVERTTLADGTLKVVTNKKGTDNDRPALFRFTYLLSETKFSIRKEVKYDGSDELFERNEYAWTR